MRLSSTQQQVLAVVRAEQPVTLARVKEWSAAQSSSHGMTQALNALIRKGFVSVREVDGETTYRAVAGRRS